MDTVTVKMYNYLSTLLSLQEERMSAFKVLLLKTLEDLGDEELTNFKWYLQQEDILEDFPAIPKSRLQNVKRVDIVDQMMLSYCIYTVTVAKKVLQRINRNDLVENLSKKASEPTGQWWEEKMDSIEQK